MGNSASDDMSGIVDRPLRAGAGLLFTGRSGLIFALVVALYAFTRLWHADSFCLDGDEIIELQAARRPWSELAGILTHDVSHPPLADLALKAWIGLGGESLFWLRLLPVLTSIAAVVPIILLCRALSIEAGAANLALALMAVNAYLIYYAQHLRMFNLLLFLTALSLARLVTYVNAPRSGAGLLWVFIVNLLLVHTHYWGWLVVGTELLYVLACGHGKAMGFLLIALGLILCSVPWFAAVFHVLAHGGWTRQDIGWIERPGWRQIAYYYSRLNGPLPLRGSTAIAFVLFEGPAIAWGLRLMAGRISFRSERAGFAFLALFAFLPVAITFAGSFLSSQSLWGERHLIIVAAPYFLLVATAIWKLRKAWLRAGVIVLSVGWACASGLHAELADNKKIRWDELVRTIVDKEMPIASEVKVYAFEDYVADPIEFYLGEAGATQFEVKKVEELSQVGGKHFWLGYRDTTWKEEETPEEILRQRGYRVAASESLATPTQKIRVFAVWRK
jgi:hypothetical protein